MDILHVGGLDDCTTCGAFRYRRHEPGCDALKGRLRSAFAKDKRAFASNPICPHCLHVEEQWSEYFHDYDDGGEKELSCPNCDKKYRATMMVSVDFMSEPSR